MHSPAHVLWLAVLSGCVALFTLPDSQSVAEEKPQAKAPVRQLLYPNKLEEVGEPLRPFVSKLLDPRQGHVEPAHVKPAGIFARVVTQNYVLAGRTLKKGGTLGSKPFVFTTLPEALYGRDLLRIFSAIGYSAEEVLTGQVGEEKAVVIFRWEEKVLCHARQDGKLPESWHNAVYPATWDNLFALVEKMVGDADWHFLLDEEKRATPTKLQLRSRKERHFLLGFPNAGKERIKASSYYALRDTRGADWEYRQFLERSMSAAEHFTGDGKCKPTILGQGKPSVGFPEFLGPNRQVVALPHVAVIGLGSLRVADR